MNDDPITPEQARLMAGLCQDILDAIEAEWNIPREPGHPGYQGTCDHHPDYESPVRATRSGAQEDNSNHLNRVGNHTIRVKVIPAEQLDLEAATQPGESVASR